MYKVVLNIPHSGTIIPEWATKDMTVSERELSFLVDFMTDKDVDKIWEFVPKQNKQVATISRLIVDTERYRNDADEIMASKGMGLYYTHTPDGKQFRLRAEDTYSKCLALYDEYHKSLEEKVSNCLEEYGKCIILDCHSFHDAMNYTGYEPSSFPDVCIGVNGELSLDAELIINAFKEKGFSVKVNEPFSGALVPLRFINDRHVNSVMIELNRRIYDNASFSAIRDICKEIYTKLNK